MTYWIETNDKQKTWEWYKAVLASLTPDCAFKEVVITKVEKVEIDDLVFHYVTGVGFIGISRVISKMEHVKHELHERDSLYPLRIGIELMVYVQEEKAVTIKQIKKQSNNPNHIHALIAQNSPIEIGVNGMQDAAFIVSELKNRQ